MKKWKLRALEVLALFSLGATVEVVAPFNEPIIQVVDAESTQEDIDFVNARVEAVKKFVLAKEQGLLPFNYGDEWYIWSLANEGIKDNGNYIDSLIEKIKAEEKTPSGVVKKPAGQLAFLDAQKAVISLSLLGGDPYNVGGYDLIKMVQDHYDPESVNTPIWSLIALDSGDYDIDQDIKDKMVKDILAHALPDGGWSYMDYQPGAKADPDMTGMALLSLAPYKNRPEVKAQIDKALNVLDETQMPDAGYESYGEESSEAVDQVIIGLTALGIDPLSNKYVKNNANYYTFLKKYELEDGSYTHSLNNIKSDSLFSTPQALLAWVSAKHYYDGLDNVFQNEASESKIDAQMDKDAISNNIRQEDSEWKVPVEETKDPNDGQAPTPENPTPNTPEENQNSNENTTQENSEGTQNLETSNQNPTPENSENKPTPGKTENATPETPEDHQSDDKTPIVSENKEEVLTPEQQGHVFDINLEQEGQLANGIEEESTSELNETIPEEKPTQESSSTLEQPVVETSHVVVPQVSSVSTPSVFSEEKSFDIPENHKLTPLEKDMQSKGQIKTLPQTGIQSTTTLLGIGGLLVLTGVIFTGSKKVGVKND